MKFRIEVIDTVYKTFEVDVPEDMSEFNDQIENYFFSLEEDELEKCLIEDDEGNRQVDLIEKLED